MSEPTPKVMSEDGCSAKELEGCAEASANEIKIDFDSIPDHVRESLAAATLESVREFLRKPGGREFLDEKKAQRKQGLNG